MINIILIGGNRLNSNQPIETINRLAKTKKMQITVLTEKVHLNKPINKNFKFKSFLEKKKINYYSVANINSEIHLLKKIKKTNNKNIVLLVGCIWKINKKIIDLFNKDIFNYHIGELPSQKGAGGASWLKLRNENNSALSIHRVAIKIDDGPLVLEKKFKLNNDFTILNYYEKVNKLEKKFFLEFLKRIDGKKGFNKILKKDSIDCYMPRLNTKINAYIDWTWSSKNISEFINSFSRPHEGAKSFINKKKVYFKKSSFKLSKLNFHPFQYGLIFKKDKKNLYILAKDGFVIIPTNEVFSKKIKKFSLGSRIYTPISYLDRSMIYRENFKKI